MERTIHYLSKTNPAKLKGVALLRLDFNTEDGWRLRAALPTVKFLLRRASKIVIVSHKGRPRPALISARDGQVRLPAAGGNGRMVGAEMALSLRGDAKKLSRLLGRPVRFVNHFNFPEIREAVARAPKKTIFVLENIRFLKGESIKRLGLAKTLASLADYYVNDAFAVSHRETASVAWIEKFLPSYAGMELEKEIKFLSRVLKNPRHPLVFVLGGGKAADKLGVIKYFKNKADHFLLGGAPANTVLFLKGIDVKKSLRDTDKNDLKESRKILKYKNVFLPTDFIWHNDAILDIGPRTAKSFALTLAGARTIIWSGPMGLIEKEPYGRSSLIIAKAIAENRKAFSLTGGGETVMFLKKHGLDKKFSFVSTGGGAMLDYLTGKKLPGIEALR